MRHTPGTLRHRDTSPSHARRQARSQAAVMPPSVPPGGPGGVGGYDERTRLLAGPWWWSQAPAAACARPRWPQRACLGAASRPQDREARRRGVGWRHVLGHGLLRVCCPAWGCAAGLGDGGRAAGSIRHTTGAARCQVVVPGTVVSGALQRCARSRVSGHLPRSSGPGGIERPRGAAAVGQREGRVPASVLSNPTTACRRRGTAYAPASLRLLPAPEAQRWA
jgi:hypothetical protein